MAERAERHRRPVGRAHVNVLQLCWIALKVLHRLENDVILVRLCKQSRDLALPERVVERLIDLERRDSETRSSDAIDHERGLGSTGLLVGCDILKLRQRLQLRDKAAGPGI